jgi:hypothetical protein
MGAGPKPFQKPPLPQRRVKPPYSKTTPKPPTMKNIDKDGLTPKPTPSLQNRYWSDPFWSELKTDHEHPDTQSPWKHKTRPKPPPKPGWRRSPQTSDPPPTAEEQSANAKRASSGDAGGATVRVRARSRARNRGREDSPKRRVSLRCRAELKSLPRPAQMAVRQALR